MGYRSDVRIMTTKKGYDELKKYVEEHISKYKGKNLKEGTVAEYMDYDYNLLNHTDISCLSSDESEMYFGWNYLKWYDGYEDVDAIMDGLNHLEQNNFSYRYARMGESYDDYEEQYYESEIDEEKDLEYPNMIREFDDDWIIDQMKLKSIEKEMEV